MALSPRLALATSESLAGEHFFKPQQDVRIVFDYGDFAVHDSVWLSEWSFGSEGSSGMATTKRLPPASLCS